MYGNEKIKDFTIKGECSKCGECCGHLLPVTPKEVLKIKLYCRKNKIKSFKVLLTMESKIYCPFFNGSKCLIYEVRPQICKEYYCNKHIALDFSGFNKKHYENARVVNMWNVFG